MSDDYKRRLKTFFDQADTSGDGGLSIQEVKAVMDKIGSKLSDAEIADYFVNDDKDKDSKISFDEFWTANNKRDPKDIKEEELRAVFRDFSGGTQFITASQLKDAICGKIELSDEAIEEMINKVDKNNDDKVNFEEFLVMWKSGLC